MLKEILYTCSYCQQPFKTEGGFRRHECVAMRKQRQFESLTGKTAWNFYKQWMKVKYRSVNSHGKTFLKSKYFTVFYNFVKFTRRTNLPDVGMYINLMVRTNIDPKYWDSDVAYGKYLEHLTRKAPPKELTKIGIKTLIKISEMMDVPISDVFDVLFPNDIIQLLRQGKVSPWILLNSQKFIKFYNDKTSKEERMILESLINPKYWDTRFNKHPQDVEKAKYYVAEMGL